eukprot:3592723-Rhodomonas_salina.2
MSSLTLVCRSSILEHLEHGFTRAQLADMPITAGVCEQDSGAQLAESYPLQLASGSCILELFGARVSRRTRAQLAGWSPSPQECRCSILEQLEHGFRNTCTACRNEPITAGVREQHSGTFWRTVFDGTSAQLAKSYPSPLASKSSILEHLKVKQFWPLWRNCSHTEALP